MKRKDIIRWLSDLIDVSKMCLLDKKPSEEYDKLMFQLESKLKELQSHPKTLVLKKPILSKDKRI